MQEKLKTTLVVDTTRPGSTPFPVTDAWFDNYQEWERRYRVVEAPAKVEADTVEKKTVVAVSNGTQEATQLKGTAPQAIEAIGKIEEVPLLVELLGQEQKGKNRKTVKDAISNKLNNTK